MYTSGFSIVLCDTHVELWAELLPLCEQRNVSESSNASSDFSSNFEKIVPDFENTFASLSLDTLLVWPLESSNLLTFCREIFLIPQGNVSGVSTETCG